MREREINNSTIQMNRNSKVKYIEVALFIDKNEQIQIRKIFWFTSKMIEIFKSFWNCADYIFGIKNQEFLSFNLTCLLQFFFLVLLIGKHFYISYFLLFIRKIPFPVDSIKIISYFIMIPEQYTFPQLHSRIFFHDQFIFRGLTDMIFLIFCLPNPSAFFPTLLES